MVFELIIVAVIIAVIYFGRNIIGGMIGLYKVVPISEAHIRIMNNKREVFSSREGSQSSYWVIPFITKLHKLPLSNLAIPVNDVKLNDKDMAKFVCDIMCFINISNLDLAAERLVLTDASDEIGFDFTRLSEDLRAIMESICRTVTTKQTIIDIYMNRQLLDEAITKEVQAVFPKWGIALVDLELKDIKDFQGSTIIADIEQKVASEKRRDALIRIATTTKEAELARAESEEVWQTRQVLRDKNVGIAVQEKDKEIAEKASEANMTQVEAERKLIVGRAEIKKDEMEQLAGGEKLKATLEAEGEASRINQIGSAEAKVIQTKKEADAAGTLKLAEALKKFDDTSINVKMIDVQKDIMIAKFNAFGQALSKAEIKWILSGDNAGKVLGLNLDANGGANLEQFIKEAGLEGILAKIKEAKK